MSKNQELNIKISGKVDPSLSKSFNSAAQTVSALEAALVSSGIVAGLTATAGAFMECVGAAEKYETAIAKVSTIYDSSQKSIGSIREELTALSNETGKSVLELAEAEYQALSASVDTADSVKFVEQANKLAVGGFTDAASAVDVLTTTLNSYGLEAEKASEISDMLILTQNKGKTTVNELASSLGQVIPTASALNTNMANVSAAYAQLTKNGIATAQAGTALKGMLNELGKSGSVVAKTLYNETGQSFASLMENGKSLGDVIDILSKSVDGDSTAFKNLWSNTRASSAALTLLNAGAEEYNAALDDMENSAGATAKAYATMTSTAEHAQEVFKTSAENLQITIGDILSPQVEELYHLGTDGLQLINEFVKANPEIVQALAAGAVGLGVVAGGLVAYTAGTKIATTVTNLFTAAMEANPLFMGLTITAGVITAVALFANAMANATIDANQLTAASQKQKDELDRLNDEYKETCLQYGSTSDEALELKDKIYDLTKEFEADKETIGELIQKQIELNDLYDKLKGEDKAPSLEEEAASADFYARKMFELADNTSRTAAETQQLHAYYTKLKELNPDLGIEYGDVISKTEEAKKAAEEYLDAFYGVKQNENAEKQFASTSELLEKQKNQLKDLGRDYWAAVDEYNKSDGNAAAYNKYEKAVKSLVEVQNASGETVKMSLEEAVMQAADNIEAMEGELEEFNKTMLGTSSAAEKNTSAAKEWKHETTVAIQDMQTGIDALAVAYDKAYAEAYKAIKGTVGLTTELSNETDMTATKMRVNWQSQAKWVNNYAENVKKAQKYGISEGLIKSLSDGSEQSGQYINQIISELNRMNETDAKSFVEGLNKDFEEVGKAQEAFAKSVGLQKVNFNKQMNDMARTARKAVKEMGLKDEAYKEAKKTINGYVDGIKSGIREVDSAALAVSKAVSKYLKPKNIEPRRKSDDVVDEKNAGGTRHSANIFLAGEKGPELIVNAGGSQVFTAVETQRILSQAAQAGQVSPIDVTVDVPGLLAQLSPGGPEGGLSVNDLLESLSDTVNNDNSAEYHITYSPKIEIKGNNITAEDVERAEKLSLAEFEKLMERYKKSNKRVKFS